MNIKRVLDCSALFYYPVFCQKVMRRVLFAFLLVLVSVASAQARQLDFCGHSFEADPFRVRTVLDGDTLVLADGRVVRLIGVNTPELNKKKKGKKKKRSEPYAKQAKKYVAALIGKNNPVYLYEPGDEKDKYGRSLAHVFLLDGRSLANELLDAGLAFRIAFDSGALFQSCYEEAEHRARSASARIWSSRFWQHNAKNKPAKTGFTLLSGRVSSVSRSRRAVWISLGKYVVLKLPESAMAGRNLNKVIERGNCLEARGWLVQRSLSRSQKKRGFAPYILPITHRSMVSASSEGCD